MGTPTHLFIAGVPAVGKTRLGTWLSGRGYIHVDAEAQGGASLDAVGIHPEWDQLVNTGQAAALATAISRLGKPLVIAPSSRSREMARATPRTAGAREEL